MSSEAFFPNIPEKKRETGQTSGASVIDGLSFCFIRASATIADASDKNSAGACYFYLQGIIAASADAVSGPLYRFGVCVIHVSCRVVRFVQLLENARSHPLSDAFFFSADHDDLIEIYIF